MVQILNWEMLNLALNTFCLAARLQGAVSSYAGCRVDKATRKRGHQTFRQNVKSLQGHDALYPLVI